MIENWHEGVAAETHDICIIGSGPAGLTVAMELSRLGRRVLVLESGSTRPSAAQALAEAEIVDAAAHDSMAIAVARRLGGASNLWGGRCMPLDPTDFVPRTFAGGQHWPIQYDELVPYYAAACGYAQCGEAVFTVPFAGERHGFSAEAIERASNIPALQKAHAQRLSEDRNIRLVLQATVIGLESGADGRIVSAVTSGPDGHRVAIKASRFVLAAGGLESARLLLILQREAPDRFGGPDGPLGRYYMGHIIGEIADITFASAEAENAFDFFKDGRGSYVRRRIIPTLDEQQSRNLPNIAFWPVVPPIADPCHRDGALSAVALALATPILSDVLLPKAIRARHLDGAVAFWPHMRNVAQDLPATIDFLSKFVSARYLSQERIPGYFKRNRARRYGLSYHSEQSPRADSRVTLTDQTDAAGAPKLRIDLRFHREDAEAVARAHESVSAFLSRAGLGTVHYRQPAQENVDAVMARMSHGTHQIGLTRMGRDRREGVVNGDLQCFDAPNLYVASSSVFPTSGQANPTLSIIAFAVRLAERLAA